MSALLILIWAALFLVPPTVKGRHATHNAARIIKPLGPLNPDGSTTEWANIQERGEYRLHKLFGIAAGVPFLFVQIDPPMIALLLQIIAMLGADQFTRAINAIDYAGHAAEIIAAESDGAIGYRESEIVRMSDDHDKRGQNVAAMLLRWEWLGRVVYILGRWWVAISLKRHK